jgi:hypothetical protein
MRSKLIALTLAVALAVSGTGIAAAGSVSPDTTDAPTPENDTDTTDDAENATRLTTDEFTMWGGENTTVVEDDPIRLTADGSFTVDFSSGEIESAGDGLFVIELPDATDEADGENATDD